MDNNYTSNISLVKYQNLPDGTQADTLIAVIDGVTSFVGMNAGNPHYDEIMRQVNAGTLTIQDAD